MENHWQVNPKEAVQLQKSLAHKVDVQASLDWDRCHFMAATDVSFDIGSNLIFAAVVLFHRRSGEVVERQGASLRTDFPYVPGLLSFREIPSLLLAFERLQQRPDVVICDGQGIAHPRRIGIASHLGVCLDLPTVGCAKSLLCGTAEEPSMERGSEGEIWHRGELIGVALRTRKNVSPVYVSPGHRCTLTDAVRLVNETTTRYRLPDPIREVHRYVNELRRTK